MTVKRVGLAALGAAIAITSMVALKAEAADQYIPLLVYRTGPYAPSGIPSANGFVDYFKMLNARDKGVNGVNNAWEE